MLMVAIDVISAGTIIVSMLMLIFVPFIRLMAVLKNYIFYIFTVNSICGSFRGALFCIFSVSKWNTNVRKLIVFLHEQVCPTTRTAWRDSRLIVSSYLWCFFALTMCIYRFRMAVSASGYRRIPAPAIFLHFQCFHQVLVPCLTAICSTGLLWVMPHYLQLTKYVSAYPLSVRLLINGCVIQPTESWMSSWVPQKEAIFLKERVSKRPLSPSQIHG